MRKHYWAAALVLAALFAAACQDENVIPRPESFTGLWSIEAFAAQTLIFEWEQDGSDLRGDMYLETFTGTQGPFPLYEGRVSGETVTWSIRRAELGGTDSLYFRGDLDTPNVIRAHLTICTDTTIVYPVTVVRDASGF